MSWLMQLCVVPRIEDKGSDASQLLTRFLGKVNPSIKTLLALPPRFEPWIYNLAWNPHTI